jgi:hypothetical protein
MGWQSVHMVECLPRKHETLSSNPSTAKNKILKDKDRLRNYSRLEELRMTRK